MFRLIRVLAVAALASAPSGVAQEAANLDWPFYGNDVGGMRFVDADHIDRSNVSELVPAWIFHTGVMSDATSFESQPLAVGGRLYVTSPHGHVFALDAKSGEILWTYDPELPPLSELAICCGQVNRGAAYGNGRVFVYLLDATLVALNANTGRELWKTEVDDWREARTGTMAPLFVEGKVIVGVSGGEFQTRGHLSAYDGATGEIIWRFNTVPGEGEFGNDTWEGDSWKTGGATVWTTPVADPELDLLYITTGNAAPDLNGANRAGDNLFSASIVALNLDTGEREWHFQEVHHDLWDYDAAQPPHLFTFEGQGQTIPAIGHANKNGNYFILDRRTGEPIFEVTETPVPTDPAWQNPSPTQPSPATEPLIPQIVENPPEGVQTAPMWTPPQETPLLIQPGFEAGPEWAPSAYSPRTRMAYLEAGGVEPWLYHAIPAIVNSLGSTGVDAVPGAEQYGLLDAVDTTTGRIAWQIRMLEKFVSGVAVAGDLVFYGEGNGKFNAADAETGKVLWTFETEREGVGGANGSPAVYVVDSREYVVMPFGGNRQLRSNGQASPVGDALIAFALPEGNGGQPNIVRAEPEQVETGAIPEEAMIEPVDSVPPGTPEIMLSTHDFSFIPNTFTVPAGQQVAVRIRNMGIPPAGFAVMLPAGPIALKGPVAPQEEAILLFKTPEEPGAFTFVNPIGPFKFFGMRGVMRVAPPCPPGQSPCISGLGIVSATGFLSTAVAPGKVISIFGEGLGPQDGRMYMVEPDGSLPTEIAGVRVLINNVPAPLLWVQRNQVNAIAPFGLEADSAEVIVQAGAGQAGPATVTVAPTSPAIFTMTGALMGQAAALNADGTLNGAQNRAGAGETIQVFVTGLGQTDPPSEDGGLATDDSAAAIAPIELLIGGQAAEIVSAAPSIFSGVVAVTARVPDNVPSGAEVPIQLVAGSLFSPAGPTVAIE